MEPCAGEGHACGSSTHSCSCMGDSFIKDMGQEARLAQRWRAQQRKKWKAEQEHQRLLRTVKGLQRELNLASERDARSEVTSSEPRHYESL